MEGDRPEREEITWRTILDLGQRVGAIAHCWRTGIIETRTELSENLSEISERVKEMIAIVDGE